MRGAGACAVHYAEHGEPCVRVLQHIAARGGRHAGRRHDDHLLHADAVCAAALAGAFAGRAADYLLQLRCKAPGAGESRVPDTADFVLGVLGGAGADVHLCAADFCLSADPGRGAARVRNSMRAPIHGGRDDFRRADCVSTDVCGAGECEVQPISGVPAQADSADSAGVSAAAVHSGHGVCDFPRRTDCGCARGLVHGDAVRTCVQKDNAGNCGLMAAWQAAGFLAAKKGASAKSAGALFIANCSLLIAEAVPPAGACGAGR